MGPCKKIFLLQFLTQHIVGIICLGSFSLLQAYRQGSHRFYSYHTPYVYPVYVEESHRQPINNYEPIYMRGFGITYSCLSTKHAEILQAQQAYEKTKEDIAKLCANNDTTTYAFCVEGCSSENYKACEQECYSKVDWTCSVNPTYSPEYRNLETSVS